MELSQDFHFAHLTTTCYVGAFKASSKDGEELVRVSLLVVPVEVVPYIHLFGHHVRPD